MVARSLVLVKMVSQNPLADTRDEGCCQSEGVLQSMLSLVDPKTVDSYIVMFGSGIHGGRDMAKNLVRAKKILEKLSSNSGEESDFHVETVICWGW